jgi:hypothetical protein
MESNHYGTLKPCDLQSHPEPYGSIPPELQTAVGIEPTRNHALQACALTIQPYGQTGGLGWVRASDAHLFRVALYRLSYESVNLSGESDLN